LLVVAGALVVVAAVSGSVLAATGALSNDNIWPYAGTGDSAVLAAVGDISCQPGPKLEKEADSDVCTGDSTRNAAQAATANQIEADHPDLVAILGDEQYQVGRYEDFMGSYNNTYGAFKFLQRPSPGNHEFYTSHGETGDNGVGYFDYFNGFQLNQDGSPKTDTYPITTGGGGSFSQPTPRPDGQAGEVGQGWYSYDLGDWHIISLNVECETQPGGCNPNGSWFQGETQWLAQDLAADHAQCTLAYWHQPTFSPTETTVSVDGQTADAWWKLLYQQGADIVLNGHDHVYARYQPLDPNGNPDPKKGIREFIVGTGGESLDTLVPTATSQYLQASTDQFYGTMKLTLNHNSYNWDYESALRNPGAPSTAPQTYSDTGSGQCHGPANGQVKQPSERAGVLLEQRSRTPHA
jgi:hypothetical protein